MEFGTMHDASMLSQLTLPTGMVDFPDGWSVSSCARLPPSKLSQEREAFEGGAVGGHCEVQLQQQQEMTSSSTSSEMQIATGTQQGPNRAGKRKAAAGKELVSGSTRTTSSSGKAQSLEGDPKCLKASHNNAGPSVVPEVVKAAAAEPEPGDSGGGSVSPSSLKASSKLRQEPPKQDYIHVRARRGQATDSHSLAERVRREKISERMKFLQDLVPGCSKVTGKAGMLDEIINYVQSLQRQIEFLSMKLAAIDSQLDINLEHQFHKELAAPARSPETTLLGPDSSAGYREYHSHLQLQQQINNCNMDLRSVGSLCDAYLRSSMNNYAPTQLVPLAYAESILDPFTQDDRGVNHLVLQGKHDLVLLLIMKRKESCADASWSSLRWRTSNHSTHGQRSSRQDGVFRPRSTSGTRVSVTSLPESGILNILRGVHNSTL